MTAFCFLFVLFFVFPSSRGEAIVNIVSDGPALINSNITFYAKLLGVKNSTDYRYTWSVDRSQHEGWQFDSMGLSCNLSMSLPTKGHFVMNLVVAAPTVFPGIYKTIAKGYLPFNITDTLNGHLLLHRDGIQPLDPNIVAANQIHNFSFVLHDPSNYLGNATFIYMWKLDNEIIGRYSDQMSINFTTGSHVLSLSVVAVIQNSMHNTMQYYLGSFTYTVKAREAIQNVTVNGDTTLRLGDILDLEITCNGSPLWSYCWRLEVSDVNASSQNCGDPMVTNVCQFLVIRFISTPGLYKLVLIIDNDLSHIVRVIDVTVRDNAPVPQLSTIIVPLVCSCLALAIIVVGAAFYVQSKRHYQVEVADFDFQQSDSYDYLSFQQRLKESMKDACSTFKHRRMRRMCSQGVESDDDEEYEPPLVYGKVEVAS